jgi:hypothetical protein
MHVGRIALSLLLATSLLAPPAAAGAAKRREPPKPVPVPTAEQCKPLPAASPELPWSPGEKLAYDIDLLGAYAGKLSLVALPSVGTGTSKEYPLRALAATNSFVSQMKRFRGRATSYVRSRDLHPRRYREDTNEGGLVRTADVVFGKRDADRKVTVEWTKAKQKGKRTQKYANDAFDPVAAAYYLRAIDLAPGQSLCFDAYGLRYLWRVSGSVQGVETVTVPAGTFQAYHFTGTAVRIDNPRRHREVHLWIQADGAKLPLAGMLTMSFGPVRAQLVAVGTSTGAESEDTLLAPESKTAGGATTPASGRTTATDEAASGKAKPDPSATSGKAAAEAGAATTGKAAPGAATNASGKAATPAAKPAAKPGATAPRPGAATTAPEPDAAESAPATPPPAG